MGLNGVTNGTKFSKQNIIILAIYYYQIYFCYHLTRKFRSWSQYANWTIRITDTFYHLKAKSYDKNTLKDQEIPF